MVDTGGKSRPSRSRQRPWALLVALVCFRLLAGCDGQQQADDRPNIIVYMVDTLRARELGCYGADITRTPAIDNFARNSLLFERATSPASSTRPSVASFVTGVVPPVHGVQTLHDHLGPGTESLIRLPELLQQQGYYTGALVANPNVDAVFGFDRGFDDYKGLYYQRHDHTPASPRDLIYTAEMVNEEIRRFIQRAPPDRPFFLFVLAIDPHGPYTPPAPYDAMYNERAAGGSAGKMAALLDFDRRIAIGETPSPELMLALYRGEVSYLDTTFGELLGWIDERGFGDNTVLALTADHGEEFLEHGLRGHGNTLYQETTHIPLIIHDPAATASGQRRPQNVDLLDLSTTIARIAGASVPVYWIGRDLMREIRPRAVYSSSQTERYAYHSIADGKFKLINNGAEQTTELYDLDADPWEASSLNGTSHEAVRADLQRRLSSFDAASAALRLKLITSQVSLNPETIPEKLREQIESLGYVDTP